MTLSRAKGDDEPSTPSETMALERYLNLFLENSGVTVIIHFIKSLSSLFLQFHQQLFNYFTLYQN